MKRLDAWGSEERRPFFIRIIYFELIQPIRPRYVNVTDGQTDRQTDGRFTIATPRFALRASRGKTTWLIITNLGTAGGQYMYISLGGEGNATLDTLVYRPLYHLY